MTQQQHGSALIVTVHWVGEDGKRRTETRVANSVVATWDGQHVDRIEIDGDSTPAHFVKVDTVAGHWMTTYVRDTPETEPAMTQETE